MHKFRSKIIFLLVFLFSTQITKSVKYVAMPLENLKTVYTDSNFISFNYKIFDKKDCARFLGRSKIIDRGYQPIQISITNNSKKNLVFSLADFSFECIDSFEVAESVHFNTTARVVGWTIGGLFLWPFFIPAVVEAVETPRANYNLDIDFARKSLTDQTISPFSTINGLIFVLKRNFNKKFSFKLVDIQNNQIFDFSTDKSMLKLPNV